MRNHLTGLRGVSVVFGLAAAAACATSTNTGGGFQPPGGQGGSSTATAGTGASTGTGGTSGGGGVSLSGGSGGGPSLVGAGGSVSGMPTDARAQRCDDAGNCHCFNIATVGLGGHTGAQSGATMGAAGTDNTQSFVNYINTQSSAGAAQVGCGADVGCVSKPKPDLSAPGFLAQYDVLIFQWMANSLAPVTMMGTSYGFTGDPALGGGGYWVFSQAELDALKAWVMGGGGVIVLSGFDYCPNATLLGCTAGSMGELGPTNQIIQALTDIKYTETDTFGLTVTGNAEFCLGGSDPVGGWAAAPDLLGENIMEVGAFHGRGITPGPNATVDCESGTTVCAAHEDVGKGHVYAYTDEWVTYTSQWNAQLAGYCSLDGSTANGDVPAAAAAYQVPQFWTNAISYAASATMCPFALPNTMPPR